MHHTFIDKCLLYCYWIFFIHKISLCPLLCYISLDNAYILKMCQNIAKTRLFTEILLFSAIFTYVDARIYLLQCLQYILAVYWVVKVGLYSNFEYVSFYNMLSDFYKIGKKLFLGHDFITLQSFRSLAMPFSFYKSMFKI